MNEMKMHLTTLEVSFLKKLAFSDTKQVKSFKIKAKSQQITILLRARPSSAQTPARVPKLCPARKAAGPHLL